VNRRNIFIKGTVTHGCVDTRGSIYNYTCYCLILDGQSLILRRIKVYRAASTIGKLQITFKLS
jgi:hypothetical protein